MIYPYQRVSEFSSFLRLRNTPLFCIELTHSIIDEHLGCFCFWSILINTAMNSGIHISIWISAFNAFWYLPRRGMAGPYGNFV
jgi:hypothetical protein